MIARLQLHSPAHKKGGKEGGAYLDKVLRLVVGFKGTVGLLVLQLHVEDLVPRVDLPLVLLEPHLGAFHDAHRPHVACTRKETGDGGE